MRLGENKTSETCAVEKGAIHFITRASTYKKDEANGPVEKTAKDNECCYSAKEIQMVENMKKFSTSQQSRKQELRHQ